MRGWKIINKGKHHCDPGGLRKYRNEYRNIRAYSSVTVRRRYERGYSGDVGVATSQHTTVTKVVPHKVEKGDEVTKEYCFK